MRGTDSRSGRLPWPQADSGHGARMRCQGAGVRVIARVIPPAVCLAISLPVLTALQQTESIYAYIKFPQLPFTVELEKVAP
jgi:hypothetical protein